MNQDGTLTPYTFAENLSQDPVMQPQITEAASWNGIAVKKDGQSQVILLDNESNPFSGSQYEHALWLRAEDLRSVRDGSPVTSERIRNSFKAHVLTRNTAFIVVETKGQERELLLRQERLFNGTYIEEARLPERSLAEPPVWLLAGLMLLMTAGISGRKRRN